MRQIVHLTDVEHPDAVLADQAITALAHTGRALIRLAEDHDDRQQHQIIRRQLVVRELGNVGRAAASRWAPAHGRLPDLAGVAADILGTRDPRLDEDSRWAAAATMTAVTRRCVEAASRFAPYARAPELIRVNRVVAMVERLAAVDAPRARPCSALGALIPVPEPPPDLPAGRLVVESTAGLVAALEREMRANVLHLYAVLAAAAAAEIVARHAAASTAGSPAPGERQPWARTPAAWRAVQAALLRFDDGSRYTSAPPSSVTRWAMHLAEATGRLSDAGRRTSPADRAELAAATRFAAGQLPSIAVLVEQAMYRWVGDGKLFARARSLPPSAHYVRAVVRDEVVIATPDDLSDVVASARAAGRLSVALATEIERSAIISYQPRLVLDLPLPSELQPGRLSGGADGPGLSSSREDWLQRAIPHIAR